MPELNMSESAEAKRKTPLSIALAEKKYANKASPMDAFLLGKNYWLKCQRLNLGAMAEELGVSRATLFRWIGNKDLLLGEIIWAVYKPTVMKARELCPGEGVEYVVNVFRSVNKAIFDSEPFGHFLRSDGQYALGILSSKTSSFHGRMVELNTELLNQQVALGSIHPTMNIDSLSYFMIRIGESCTLSEMIIGQKPDLARLEDACSAVRILLGGNPDKN